MRVEEWCGVSRPKTHPKGHEGRAGRLGADFLGLKAEKGVKQWEVVFRVYSFRDRGILRHPGYGHGGS